MDARVRRGMAVLDHFSPDWDFRVRPEQVTSIKDATKCILCAVFGTYARGLEILGLYVVLWDDIGFGVKGRAILECGFCSRGHGLDTDDDMHLTAAWQAAIQERRQIQELQEATHRSVFEEGFA